MPRLFGWLKVAAAVAAAAAGLSPATGLKFGEAGVPAAASGANRPLQAASNPALSITHTGATRIHFWESMRVEIGSVNFMPVIGRSSSSPGPLYLTRLATTSPNTS
jgi:hypothetical protein